MSKWIERKKLDILTIKEKIKENSGIKLITLMSKLTVEEPFMSRNKAFSLLEDMKNAGHIKVDNAGVVSLCP